MSETPVNGHAPEASFDLAAAALALASSSTVVRTARLNAIDDALVRKCRFDHPTSEAINKLILTLLN